MPLLGHQGKSRPAQGQKKGHSPSQGRRESGTSAEKIVTCGRVRGHSRTLVSLRQFEPPEVQRVETVLAGIVVISVRLLDTRIGGVLRCSDAWEGDPNGSRGVPQKATVGFLRQLAFQSGLGLRTIEFNILLGPVIKSLTEGASAFPLWCTKLAHRASFPQLSTSRFATPQDVHRHTVFATCAKRAGERKV